MKIRAIFQEIDQYEDLKSVILKYHEEPFFKDLSYLKHLIEFGLKNNILIHEAKI